MVTAESLRKELRAVGSRATTRRLSILKVLSTASKPLSVAAIYEKLRGKLDRVTLYRALEALRHGGLVQRIDLGHSHAHYELSLSGTHHHHLVCNRCGKVEDLNLCTLEAMEKTVLRKTHSFREIQGHSLEFFGLCKACSR